MSSKDYIYCYQGKALRVAGGTAVVGLKYDPYNPLGLPPLTIRLRFKSGYTPRFGNIQKLVDAEENIWDITKNSTNWRGLVPAGSNLLEVLGANTSDVTNMSTMFSGSTSLTSVSVFDTSSCDNMQSMFYNCISLSSVPLFDTSSCTDMMKMFYGCSSLSSVPLFDTSSCTDMSMMFLNCTSFSSVPLFDTISCTTMDRMFRGCANVQSGALALYQQASIQLNVPSHVYCFTDCGSNTVTGAAELAQIPTSWGGTMAE